ncbi:hypothetical protein POG22_09320 [Geitlerinema sp. CS-897]|nr:hypothetical protein [Geitlerinema sp. CS-897]
MNESLNSNSRSSIVNDFVRILIVTIGFATALFLASGAIDWLMGWVYVSLIATSQAIVAIFLIQKKPDLASERVHFVGKRDLDRIFAGIMAFYSPLAVSIVSSLNYRYEWQPSIPFGRSIALGIAILGIGLTIWAMTIDFL